MGNLLRVDLRPVVEVALQSLAKNWVEWLQKGVRPVKRTKVRANRQLKPLERTVRGCGCIQKQREKAGCDKE